ncbi:MAG: phytoene desaturase family protein [Flavobacteriales bacterium]
MSAHSSIIIGSGISGLAAAAVLAQRGVQVTVLERNATVGGRARTWEHEGFTFDMGASFYWMPDVFERFFARFGTSAKEHYDLRLLSPSYSVIFGPDDRWDLPAGREAVAALFDREEPGAGKKLGAFLDEAAVKYRLGMQDIVYKPSLSWAEYVDPRVLLGLFRTSVLSSLRSHVRKMFTSDRIRRVMEFPVLFLGATPQNTPALYSLMNHADIDLGTWYPMGGMGKMMDAMQRVAEDQGAVIRTSDAVKRIIVKDGKAIGVESESGTYKADIVLATADYHHVEMDLLPAEHRSYSKQFWKDRTMAPSTLLFYIGLDILIPNMQHHTLFFDEDLDRHGADIYTHERWPEKPLFYVSCTSKTDPSVAPSGCENLVILIPIASGSVDDDAIREHYFHIVADRMQRHFGVDIRQHIKVKRSYCVKDLETDYNAFRGNAYGLASTLLQTGPLRPRVKSKKVRDLYYAGQLSVPGPGLPPALISGQVAADLILKEHNWS